MTDDCLFCRIVAGDVPAAMVAEEPDALAFRDIDPKAPTHVLVIPRRHVADVGALADDAGTAAAVLRLARRVAESEGLGEGWRLVFNTGAAAGQTVFHVHGHVLGGRPMGWPPG